MSISATARIISLVACLALAGCGGADFDKRYADKEKELASEQAALEKDLDRRMTEKPGLESATPAPGETAAQ
jgi:hypothetical protein